jgi:hypothetical protein
MAFTRWFTGIPAAAIVLGCAATAAAQPAPPPSRFAVGFNGGWAVPAGAFEIDPLGQWEVTLRGTMTPHVVVEGFFSDWGRTKRTLHTDVDLQGPNGFLGHVDRIEESLDQRLQTIGVNVERAFQLDRATLSTGGGIGAMMYSKRFSQTTSGCDPAVATACRSYSNPFSNSSMTGQGVVDLDVTITRRVHVSGRWLLVVPFQDPAYLHTAAGGGVRIVLW